MSFHDAAALAGPELILAISALALLVWGAFQGKTNALFTLAAMAALVAAAVYFLLASVPLFGVQAGHFGNVIADIPPAQRASARRRGTRVADGYPPRRRGSRASCRWTREPIMWPFLPSPFVLPILAGSGTSRSCLWLGIPGLRDRVSWRTNAITICHTDP